VVRASAPRTVAGASSVPAPSTSTSPATPFNATADAADEMNQSLFGAPAMAPASAASTSETVPAANGAPPGTSTATVAPNPPAVPMASVAGAVPHGAWTSLLNPAGGMGPSSSMTAGASTSTPPLGAAPPLYPYVLVNPIMAAAYQAAFTAALAATQGLQQGSHPAAGSTGVAPAGGVVADGATSSGASTSTAAVQAGVASMATAVGAPLPAAPFAQPFAPMPFALYYPAFHQVGCLIFYTTAAEFRAILAIATGHGCVRVGQRAPQD